MLPSSLLPRCLVGCLWCFVLWLSLVLVVVVCVSERERKREGKKVSFQFAFLRERARERERERAREGERESQAFILLYLTEVTLFGGVAGGTVNRWISSRQSPSGYHSGQRGQSRDQACVGVTRRRRHAPGTHFTCFTGTKVQKNTDAADRWRASNSCLTSSTRSTQRSCSVYADVC